VDNLIHASSIGTYYNQNFRSQGTVHGPFDCRDHPVPVYPAAAQAAQTSRLEFVTEYVRELGANEDMRELAAKDIAEAGTDQNSANSAMIRSSTRIILELNAQITALRGMVLDGKFADLPKNIADFYQQKIDVHQRMIEIAKTFMAGPKPNVDYGAIAAELPQFTAMIE
jgi:hypothetical protein